MNAVTVPSFALPMRMPRFQSVARSSHRARLRIGDVDVVLRVDVDAARTAELVPRVEQLAVLIEDLDPVVAAIADEQAAPANPSRARAADRSRRGRCPTGPTS